MQLFDEAMDVVNSQSDLAAFSERYTNLVDRITDIIHVVYAKHGLAGFVHDVKLLFAESFSCLCHVPLRDCAFTVSLPRRFLCRC